MKNSNILSPLFKKIDKVILGIDDVNEIENKSKHSDYYHYVEYKDEEEFDVERSIN